MNGPSSEIIATFEESNSFIVFLCLANVPDMIEFVYLVEVEEVLLSVVVVVGQVVVACLKL